MSYPPNSIYSVTDGVASPATKRKYEYHFKCFLKHFDIIHSQSLLQLNDPRQIEAMIITYIKYLANEKHQKYNTIHHTVAAIIHFFDMNDVVLNKRKINKFIPPDESSKYDRAYTTEEIQRILLYCDERSRVIFLLMASTGMRIGAIPNLKFGDLEEIPHYNLYKITVYANSKRDRYYTFCTPECKEAIVTYRRYRERFSESIHKDSPLIREAFDIDSHYHCEHPKPVALRGIEMIVQRALTREGVTSDEVMRSHGLRKRWVTMMKKAKVDFSDREYLCGHKHSRGLDVNYDRTSEEDRLNEFVKGIDYLTINSEHRFKNRIHELEAQHSEEWNNLKSEMNELKQILESFGVDQKNRG
jgi:integrase